MLSKNIVAFRNQALVLNPGARCEISLGIEQAATISAELMKFGYILSSSAFQALTECSTKFAINWIEEIVPFLNEMTGGGAEYKPLHAGFPQSVMAMSEFELYWKAVTHYWSRGKWYPDDALVKKGYKYEHVEYKVIERISDTEFENIFSEIAQSNVPVTESDYKILEWFVKDYGFFTLPASIPLKENLCLIAALGVDVPVKTPTDVLRIATYMSNGTTDLILPPKKIKDSAWGSMLVDNPEYKKARFKKFTRAERRLLLGLLDKVADASEMVLRSNRWIRLGEILHPGEYSSRFQKAYKAFQDIRNTKVRSWYSQVEKAFEDGLTAGLAVLSQRPGEFARRLDSLIRHNPSEQQVSLVFSAFQLCASRVSNKVLFELLAHFKERVNDQKSRRVFIPGARQPVELPLLKALPIPIVERIERSILDTLRDKFAMLNPLGDVYIDPKLKKIPLPSNMKTLTDTLNVKVRGTRMPLKVDSKVLRAYTHWTAGVDLDISMEFLNVTEDGYDRNSCTYHNLRPFAGVYHSGDVIPDYVGNHAEYIDIVLDECPYRYGLITLRNFSGGPIANTGAVLGFMEREFPESNTTWYPKTITNSYRLESSGNILNIAIIDFKTREWILIDEDGRGIPISTGKDLANYINTVRLDPEFSVYDLLCMHAEARGVLKDYSDRDEIESGNDFSTVFHFSDFCESYKETIKYML
jgi:hypothetical protein